MLLYPELALVGQCTVVAQAFLLHLLPWAELPRGTVIYLTNSWDRVVPDAVTWQRMIRAPVFMPCGEVVVGSVRVTGLFASLDFPSSILPPSSLVLFCFFPHAPPW